jgi:hypothetical protein
LHALCFGRKQVHQLPSHGIPLIRPEAE